ncbi:MAG: beta-galactosidase, partial [Phycisphaeraceae bacterium JB051]
HVQPFTQDMIWQADSLQIALDSGLDRTAGRDNNDYEIGLAKTQFGYEVHPFHIPPETVFPSQTVEWELSRNNGQATYQVQIPFATLSVFDPTQSQSMGLSLLINNLDQQGRQTTGWHDAISKDKNPSKYGTIIFDPSDQGFGVDVVLRTTEREFYADQTILGTVLLPRTGGDVQHVEVRIELANANQSLGQDNLIVPVKMGENLLDFQFNASTLSVGENQLTVMVIDPSTQKLWAKRQWTFTRFDASKIKQQTLTLLSQIKPLEAVLADKLKALEDSAYKPHAARVTLGVLQQFIPYIQGDLDNGHFPQALYQARQLMALAHDAIRTLDEGSSRLIKLPQPDPVIIKQGGFANAAGESLFLSGGWALSRFPKEQVQINELLGMNSAAPFAGYPMHMYPTEDSYPDAPNAYAANQFRKYQKAMRPQGISQVVQLNTLLPNWAKQKHPEMMIPGNHTFWADPDHPYFNAFWEQYVRHTIGFLVETYSKQDLQNIVAIEILNEPTFSSISSYTIPKFQAFLKQTYQQIEKLNGVWQTSYTAFDQVGMKPTLSAMLTQPAVYYDWCIFNNKRFADFYRMTMRIIQSQAPDVQWRFMSKFSNEHIWGNRFDYNTGHDRQQLSDIMDINSCDTRVLPEPNGRYGLNHWVSYCMSYELLKSFAPDKPVFDTEIHNIQTVRFTRTDIPRDYTAGTLWLGAMHGLNGALMWDMWTNVRLRTEYAGKPFRYAFGQFLTQPRSMFEFFNTSGILTERMPEILAFQNASRPIRLLYSLDSAIHDGQSYTDVMKDVYEGFFFSGQSVGFITPQMIQKQQGLEGLRLLVIPNVRYIKPHDRQALLVLQKKGVKLLLVGDECLTRSARYAGGFNLLFDDVIHWPITDADSYGAKAGSVLLQAGIDRAIEVVEESDKQLPVIHWQACDVGGKTILFLMNMGRETMSFTIQNQQTQIQNLKLIEMSAGQLTANRVTLPAYGVALLEVVSP